MAFTNAQYDILQQMIDMSIDKELDDSNFAEMSDVEDAVQSAASDARSDIRGCESSIEALESKVDNIDIPDLSNLENDCNSLERRVSDLEGER